MNSWFICAVCSICVEDYSSVKAKRKLLECNNKKRLVDSFILVACLVYAFMQVWEGGWVSDVCECMFGWSREWSELVSVWVIDAVKPLSTSFWIMVKIGKTIKRAKFLALPIHYFTSKTTFILSLLDSHLVNHEIFKHYILQPIYTYYPFQTWADYCLYLQLQSIKELKATYLKFWFWAR